MLKKFFSYGFVEGIAKGLNKLTLLILPLFIDTISYGKIGLLISIETLLPLVTLLGLDRAILRYYAKKSTFKGFKQSVFRPIIFAHAIIFILIAIMAALGVKNIFSISMFPDMLLMVLLVYYQGKNILILNMLRVEENHKKYFKGRLFVQISKFVLVVGLIFFTNNYLGYIIGSIISAVIANYFFNVDDKSNTTEQFSRETFSKLFIFSWPFIFHGIASNFLGNADKFVIERYLSMKEVGLYTLIYSLGTSISFAYVGISIFMEPVIYKETNVNKREGLLNKFVISTLGVGVSVYFLIGIISQFVLPHFYKGNYTAVLKYIPIVASAYLVFPYYLKANYRLIYQKKSFLIAAISIITSLINILLNVILIPQYGIYAGVVTTVISFIIQAGTFLLFSNNFKLRKEIFDIIMVSLIIIINLYFNIEYYYAILPLVVFVIYLYCSEIRGLKFKI